MTANKRLFVRCASIVVPIVALQLSAPTQSAEPAPPTEPRPKVVSSTGNMRIHVIDPDGGPVAKAWIYRSVWTDEKFDANREYTTDDAGSVDVELPKSLTILRIWANSNGYVPLFAQWWPQHQDHGFPIPKEFTFRLAKGSVIGGAVRNNDGEPIAGAKVEVELVDRDGDIYRDERPVVDMTLAYGGAARTTDADGLWTLDNVPADDGTQVELKVSHPDYIDDRELSETQRRPDVTMTELRAKTAVIVMHRGSVLTGTVSDPDGQPVKDAVVIWGDHPYWQAGSQEVRSDEHGVYRFPPLPAGPMHVTVAAQGWMPERTEITLAPHPRTEALNFRMTPGKKLRIRFVDPSGATVPQVAARIEKWQARSRFTMTSIRTCWIPRSLVSRMKTASMSGIGRQTAPSSFVSTRRNSLRPGRPSRPTTASKSSPCCRG